MKLFRRFADGYEAGVADAKEFIAAERRIFERVIERLEFALERAHEDFIELNRRHVEATERADIATDRLLEVYGRTGISQAYERAQHRSLESKVALTKSLARDPLAPVPYDDPECRFKDDVEARGDYA